MSEENEKNIQQRWDAFAKRYELKTVSSQMQQNNERIVLRVEVDSSILITFDTETQLKQKLRDYELGIIEIYEAQGMIRPFLLGEISS